MYHVIFKGFENAAFEFSPVAFTLFGKEIYWYGIVITVGILLSALYAFWRAKKLGIRIDDMYDYAIFVIVFGVIGARAFYVLTSLGEYKSFLDVIAIWNGGLAIYGGIIAGLLVVVIVSKIKQIKVLRVLDAIAPAVMIGQALGRWGNYFNQEAFGCNTTLPWGMKSWVVQSTGIGSSLEGTVEYLEKYVRDNTEEIQKLGMKIDAQGYVHPTFLYECLWNVIGFIIINIFYKKRKFDGQMFLMYITWYGLGRAFIEMLRTDSLFIPGTYIRISMVIGFLCFAGGLAAMIVLGIRAKKDPEKIKEGAYYGKAAVKNDPNYKLGKKGAAKAEEEAEKTDAPSEDVPDEEPEEDEETVTDEPEEFEEVTEYEPEETEEAAEDVPEEAPSDKPEADVQSEEEKTDGENN